MKIPAAPATLPPTLPGIDPVYSRLLDAGGHRFHVLDTGPILDEWGITPVGTIVAVHGNPTWSYLWRTVVEASIGRAVEGKPAWRILAPDQLDMGYSERLAHEAAPSAATAAGLGYRTLDQRIGDLDALLDAAGVTGPIVTLGHDWGGVVSLGWAGRNPDRLAAVATLNTAVHQPEGTPVPTPLRAALAGPMLAGSTIRTDAFLTVTMGLARPALDDEIRRAYVGPYATAERRGGIGGFVADIPTSAAHPSHATLEGVAAGVAALQVPALVLWGPHDPVFLERYLHDLEARLPRADVHRFEDAGHLLAEDAPMADALFRWLDSRAPADTTTRVAAAETPLDTPAPLWRHLVERADDEATATVDMSEKRPRRISWSRLSRVVDGIAQGLYDLGMRPGERVSMLVPPGNNLTAALYACLRIGAVPVVADSGLGPEGMTRAVKSANPQWIIGETPGLLLARTKRWPGRRISVTQLDAPTRAALGVETDLMALAHSEVGTVPFEGLPEPDADADAAVLFTSGSTGPAKGVVYTHRRLSALCAKLASQFRVGTGSGLVAGFPPFALLGPGIGATSVTPDMSVTKPSTLTASAVAQAALKGDATMVFASPAALRNIVATADRLDAEERAALQGIELLLSAGAPVAPALMDAVAEVFTAAEIHSPYGMTEGLLLTDIDLGGVHDAASASPGVCVGTPVEGVRLAISPVDSDGKPTQRLLEGENAVGIFGEVVVSAAHQKERYDQLWYTDALSKRDTLDGLTWHRTNDVGRLDRQGRLWIEGRVQHIVTRAQGPLGPGAVEARIDALGSVARSAIVGVGPAGTQSVVAVIEPEATVRRGPDSGARLRPGLAPDSLAAEVRQAARGLDERLDIAAVLVTTNFPTDVRHNSKIDRAKLAAWADHVLRGKTP